MHLSEYQNAAGNWLRDFGGTIAILDIEQRGDRLSEEFLELLQAVGYPKARVLAMVEHVYSRPAGTVKQEVGGAAVTLALFADVAGVSLEGAAVEELTRILQLEVMAALRAKQGERDAVLKPGPNPTPAPNIFGKQATCFQCNGFGHIMGDDPCDACQCRGFHPIKARP